MEVEDSKFCRIELFDDGKTFFRQQRSSTPFTRGKVTRIPKETLPQIKDIGDIDLKECPELEGASDMYGSFMELMSNLRGSDCYPAQFLRDAQVVTTLSALRSIVCQWAHSTKAEYFEKQPHYCQMIDGQLYLHTFSCFTVPPNSSKLRKLLYRLVEESQTLNEFNDDCYFGLAKMHLPNSIKIVYTYRIDGIFQSQPLIIRLCKMSQFVDQTDYNFLTSLLSKKVICHYDISKSLCNFDKQYDASILRSCLCRRDQELFRNIFQTDISQFFHQLLDLIDDEYPTNGRVLELEHVFTNFKLRQNIQNIESLLEWL